MSSKFPQAEPAKMPGSTPVQAPRPKSSGACPGFLLLLIIILPNVVLSADTGATSNAEISVERANAVVLSRVDDWFLGAYSALETESSLIRVYDWTCVFSTTGMYSLTIQSANGGSSLKLQSRSGDQITYWILVMHEGPSGAVRTTVRVPDYHITGMIASRDLNCEGLKEDNKNEQNWNLRFRPAILHRNFNAAPPGIYTDQITLVVTAE